MPCYDPSYVARLSSGALDFKLGSGSGALEYEELGWHRKAMKCGRCIGCKAQVAKDWSVRCFHEATLHQRVWCDQDGTAPIPDSCLLTLTYRDEELPPNKLLDHRDFQEFMYRLRQALKPRRIRFFMCGEYGGQTGRPHLHCVVFGWFPDDYRQVQLPGGKLVGWSDFAFEKWRKGNVVVDAFSFEGAGYVAGYVAKKLDVWDSRRFVEVMDPETGEPRYVDPGPEYRKMSLKPRGLAYDWISSHLEEVYEEDLVRIRGYSFKPPKFYDEVLREHYPDWHAKVVADRLVGEAEYGREWTPERARAAGDVYMASMSRRRDAL